MAFRELTNLATAQSMAKRLEDENSLSPPKTPLTWSLNAKTRSSSPNEHSNPLVWSHNYEHEMAAPRIFLGESLGNLN